MSRKPNTRQVVPKGDGTWNVKDPNASRASSNHRTQAEATERARTILNNSGGGELTVRGRNGQVRQKNTVAPGNDPYPPKG